MPTPLPHVLRFDIDSSLDTPSDGWTAEFAGADLMLAPADLANYQLPMGLLDATGGEVLAALLMTGRILERRLVGRVDERRTYVRGVDALERTFRLQRAIRYVPDPPTEPIDESELEEAGVTVKVGHWKASTIAADLVVGSGLTLTWGVRDYAFRETFDGTGTLYALLQRLVEPWNQVPQLGVDITCVGTEIRIRPRLLHPPADLTMSVAESRLVELELGPRRRLPYIGMVVLEGRPEGWQFLGTDDPDAPPEIPDPYETVVPYATPVWDISGTLISQVEGERTYLQPDNLLIRHVEREYQRGGPEAMQLVKSTTIDNTYEPSSYGPSGPLTQPLPLESMKSIWTLIAAPVPPGLPGDKVFAETSREQIIWKYDEHRFLTMTLTRRFRRTQVNDPSGILAPIISFPEVERIAEERAVQLNGWVNVLTSRTQIDPTTGKITGTTTLNQQDQAGFRPGGVRPPSSFSSTGGMPEPGRITERISTDPTAVPVHYSNTNLTRDDLDFIMEQYRAISGLVEYALRGSGPAIPDLVKGMAIHLTDYVDALGTPIPLEPAQVRRVGFGYVDTREGSEYTGTLEAVFYRSEPETA